MEWSQPDKHVVAYRNVFRRSTLSTYVRRAHRPLGDQSGISLIEILFAIALIGIGLAAVAAAFPAALSGVEAGQQQTTATFLAEQRLEQIKGTVYANITAANFPAEAYGTIPGAPTYRRTVTITGNPGSPPVTNTVRVDVSVFYRPVMAFGVLAGERQVVVSTLIASR